MSDYPGFGKIPRLHRQIIITEKIDGTNGLIHIARERWGPSEATETPGFEVVQDLTALDEDGFPEYQWVIRAGGRNRWLTLDSDNHGFAAWVRVNAHVLARDLGEGHHYGEWWGGGINRGYGMGKEERVFSLFNFRWTGKDFSTGQLDSVPVLMVSGGENLNASVEEALGHLAEFGSAATGHVYRNPEGIVVYHAAAGRSFKVTLENDEAPKALAVAA